MTILKRKRFWGLILTVGLLIYCFYDLDIYAVKTAISAIKYKFLIPLVFLEVLITFVRSLRMKYFIDPMKKIKASEMFPVYCIGTMANWMLPYLTGQVARVYLFSKKVNLPKTFFTTTTILEAVLDGFSLFALVMITSLIVAIPEEFKTWHFFVLGALIIIVGSLLIILSRSDKNSHNYIAKVTRHMSPSIRDKIDEFSSSFFSGLETLKSSKHFFLVSFLSMLSWLLQAGMVYLLIQAFGYKVNMAGAVIITALVNIMMTIVIAPGNIGTFQGATGAAMAPFGVGKSEALAFSFLLHIFVYLPPIVIGSLYAFKYGLSFKQLKDEGNKGVDEMNMSAKSACDSESYIDEQISASKSSK